MIRANAHARIRVGEIRGGNSLTRATDRPRMLPIDCSWRVPVLPLLTQRFESDGTTIAARMLRCLKPRPSKATLCRASTGRNASGTLLVQEESLAVRHDGRLERAVLLQVVNAGSHPHAPRQPEAGIAACLAGCCRSMPRHLRALWRLNELGCLPKPARVESYWSDVWL